MRTYFAGSIRAGRDDVPVYARLIAHLKQYGDVLTEHVGDYKLSLRGQSTLTDRFIHDRDVNWLLDSQVVVAEVTVPSLGVGYEIATALAHSIPVVALYRGDEDRLSAMIAGSARVNVLTYTDVDEVLPRLDSTIKEVVG